MLQLKNISISMKKDLRELISGLDLVLNKSDKAAIIGEEGNGKSTLLKLIYDESLIEPYVQYSGEVQKKGLILGYLSQELTDAEKAMTAYEFCCTEDTFLDSTPGEIAATCAKMQIPPEMLYSDRTLGTFSGGEKVKLRMALLMLKKPDVLLLDEPSNDLDIQTLQWMEQFIRETEQAVLFISHDELLLENTANMVIHVELLRKKRLPRHTVLKTDYRSYVEERLRSFSHQEQMADKEHADFRKKQERYQQIYQKVNHAQATNTRQDPHMGRLLKKKMKAVKSLGRRMDKEEEELTQRPDTEDAILAFFEEDIGVPQGKMVLDFSLEALTVEERTLARDIRLVVKGPEHIGIVGRNGVGKTTLLKMIAEELLQRKDVKAAYMPQDYLESMDMRLTPVEFLAKSSEKEELTRVRTYLGSMKYTVEECEHNLGELSGGQKAKLFFLKMILGGNNVLVLDEPTRNFSPLSSPVIRDILTQFGGAIISVSHDRKYLREVCTVLYELRESGVHRIYEV